MSKSSALKRTFISHGILDSLISVYLLIGTPCSHLIPSLHFDLSRFIMTRGNNRRQNQNNARKIDVSPEKQRSDAKQQSKVVAPGSPALSSATTLGGSPTIQFNSLKLGTGFSPLTPLKEDGLLSKGDMGMLPLSPDAQAMAGLLENMKRTLRAMQTAVSVLGRQTEKVAVLAPAIKANQELAQLREILERRTQEQADKVAKLQQRLEEEVKEAIKGKLKDQAMEMLKEAVSKKVHERVQTQVSGPVRFPSLTGFCIILRNDVRISVLWARSATSEKFCVAKDYATACNIDIRIAVKYQDPSGTPPSSQEPP
ncbi:hypothetical protein VKT23_001159 [Stygiomarasmius scandens]|uniref:Uncharacterized protein n=1 Tax=Marasmiellus scandens TaxID=2682957 RepID=A0ABR1KC77_9AGAR